MFLRLHTEILFLSIRYNSCVLLTVDIEDVFLACYAVATYLPSSTILRAQIFDLPFRVPACRRGLFQAKQA